VKKFSLYFILFLCFGLLAYNSVYFKKLSEMKKATDNQLDAGVYAKNLWEGELQTSINSAIELPLLLKSINENADTAFEQNTHALAIGNYRYAMVKLKGKIIAVNENEVLVSVALPHADSLLTVAITTDFVYGNAVRDASGLLDAKDFNNASDLNNIAEALNELVRKNIVPEIRKTTKQNNKLEIIGAVQLNREHVAKEMFEIIPLKILSIQ
jgi:predicted lipoprotein